MSDIRVWSPVDGNNNSTPPDGFPEQQPAKSLNDASRAVMGGVRRQWENKEWFEHGHNITFTAATTFQATGDQQAVYHVGRRIKCSGTLTGTVYGRILTTNFTTDTICTIELDSGSLTPESDGSERVAVGSAVTGQPVAAESLEGIDRIVPSPYLVGEIKLYAGSSVPAGWLLCDGAEYNQTTYADLFAVIGTDYGAGNGTTTFNIPDFRDRVPVGISATKPRGTTGGAETHQLTVDEMPRHGHGIRGEDDVPKDGGSNWRITGSNNVRVFSEPEGNDQPHNNMQPYGTAHYLIRYMP